MIFGALELQIFFCEIRTFHQTIVIAKIFIHNIATKSISHLIFSVFHIFSINSKWKGV